MTSSLVPTVVSIGGQSLIVIGQSIALVASVYLGEFFFGSARGIIESLPKIILHIDNQKDGNREAVKAAQGWEVVTNYLSTEGLKILKLFVLIVIGMTIKSGGNRLLKNGNFMLSSFE
jgi:hypothetical protein